MWLHYIHYATNLVASEISQHFMINATRKWEMSAEIPYWFRGRTSGSVAKFQLFSQATTFEWKRHHFSFSVWKFYVMQTVWFWALLSWTDSNSILISRRGSILVSSILRKSVRFFVINILLIIKKHFPSWNLANILPEWLGNSGKGTLKS